MLFKARTPKGVILYLYGSNNALNVWGKLAPTYTQLGYDVFMLAYRGYGKSKGKIAGEVGLYKDVDAFFSMVR